MSEYVIGMDHHGKFIMVYLPVSNRKFPESLMKVGKLGSLVGVTKTSEM